jgi:cobalt/nickel transport system permease protein
VSQVNRLIKEKLSKGTSIIHKLDPRIKLTVIIFFSIVVAINDHIFSLSAALLFSALLILVAKLRIKEVLSRLLVVNSFIFILWLMLPITFSGEKIFSLGSVGISREGIDYAFLITIKSNSIILAGIALLSTTSIYKMIHALHHLYLPDKLTQLFFFTYRYLHTIYSEFISLNNALKIRGFKPKSNFHTYKTYAYLVGMLLVRSYDRSNRVYNAMLCRGFKGKFWTLNHFHFQKIDLICGAVMMSFVLCLVVLP